MFPARKLIITVVVLVGALAAVSPASAAGQPPRVLNTTLVSGPPVAFHPTLSVADLGHGLAAGATAYLHSDGFIYTDVLAPFLWDQHGSPVLFQLPANLETVPSIYLPNAMTANGGTVVGGVIFTEELSTEPWAWTPAGGLQFLQLPADPRYGGGAVGVSSDGSVIAGTLAGRFVPSLAAIWQNGTLQMLPASQRWSAAHAISGDGTIIAGAAGPSSAAMQATRWVNGTEQQLSTGGLNPQSSVALFIANNDVTFGTATLSSGQTVLLRWAADGSVTVLTPPNGLTVASFSSIDSTGSAAGGALAEKNSCISLPNPACNHDPFVWTAQGGFTLLPEGFLTQLRDTWGDMSTVADVSNGGRVAVGTLTPFESVNGFPPEEGFVWTPQSGLVPVNGLMSGFGQPNPDYFSAASVSPNGTSMLAFGNAPNNAVNDTGALILNLSPPWNWTGQSGSVTGTELSGQPASINGPKLPAGTAQAVQRQEDPLKQRLMSLPTDLRKQLQSWPGAARIIG